MSIRQLELFGTASETDGERAENGRPSLLSRLIVAQELSARRRVRTMLLACSDERLQHLGWSKWDIAALRNGVEPRPRR